MVSQKSASKIKGPGWSLRILLVITLVCPGSVLIAEEPITLERAIRFALRISSISSGVFNIIITLDSVFKRRLNTAVNIFDRADTVNASHNAFF